jgi:hypothetical protein
LQGEHESVDAFATSASTFDRLKATSKTNSNFYDASSRASRGSLSINSSSRKAIFGVVLPAFILSLAFLIAVNPSATQRQLNPVQPYGFVNWLLKQDKDSAGLANGYILELPITRHYQYDHPRMYNQIWHNRPIMGGFLARPVIDPYRDSSSPYNWLAQQRYYKENYAKKIFNETANFNILRNLITLDKYRYIVLYKEAYRFERERARIKEIITSELGANSLVYEDDQTALYRVPTNNLGSQSALMPVGLWLGDGFYDGEANKKATTVG